MSAGSEGEPATSRTPLLTPALVAVGAVTALAVIAAGTAGGWWLEPRIWFDGQPVPGLASNSALGPPTPRTPPMAEANPVQQWIAGILAALTGLAVLVGLVYLARWLWQRRPRRAVIYDEKPDVTPAGVIAAGPDLPALLRGADAAELILTETGGVPRDLVLRCWLALEEAALASGVPRRPSDSPTEFTGTVLRSTHAERGSVDTLLRLYHRARFSGHEVTDDDVRTARTAVIRLAATWRGFDEAMRHTARTDP
ncbi:hypothetical protein GCM10022204_26190 [Microlunatus aurantiacus]|uniref:Protein-glutamine gamma-glutamyltransferase-like C-terminal domain-containing protein n=1 Tax=Microlunatus aurantiacus TaxID=446786 RepID=A0ABP7DNW0_9ACTN